jgi:hypothetical protein
MAKLWLARARVASGRFADPVAELLQLVEIDRKNPDVYQLLGLGRVPEQTLATERLLSCVKKNASFGPCQTQISRIALSASLSPDSRASRKIACVFPVKALWPFENHRCF